MMQACIGSGIFIYQPWAIFCKRTKLLIPKLYQGLVVSVYLEKSEAKEPPTYPFFN